MFFQRKSPCRNLTMGEAQQQLAQNPNIRLLDVRTPEEYRAGFIPGSINLPLDRIARIPELVPNLDIPLFVYCLSGARSQTACAQLARMGYTNVTNIGGITQWAGTIERMAGA